MFIHCPLNSCSSNDWTHPESNVQSGINFGFGLPSVIPTSPEGTPVVHLVSYASLGQNLQLKHACAYGHFREKEIAGFREQGIDVCSFADACWSSRCAQMNRTYRGYVM
jgi:hypothetical protein